MDRLLNKLIENLKKQNAKAKHILKQMVVEISKQVKEVAWK